jgi:hypothetical protein
MYPAWRFVLEQTGLIEHYQHLRGVAGEIQSEALSLVRYASMLEIGRRLGVVRGGELILETDSELKLVYDLAIHTARPGRSRAIDRYARNASSQPYSDAERVLKALRKARFTVLRFESPHAVAGAVAFDMVEKREFHFMDVSVGLSATQGDLFIARLVEIDGFRMSCLTSLPLLPELLAAALERLPLRDGDRVAEVFQDPRCAVAAYREAIALGVMQRCVTFDAAERVPTAQDVAAVRELSDRLSMDMPALTAVG